MLRRNIKLAFRYHEADRFERTRDVQRGQYRDGDPRFNRAKLFNRLFVMNGIGPSWSLHAVKTEILGDGG
jgi:hypothetical protein